MRLLHVITTLDVGGAEMHLLSQVRGQAARGVEVRVAYLKGHGTLCDDFRAAGAAWVGCVGSAGARLWSHLRWAELVHTHLLKADAAGAVWATLAGRRRGLVSGKHNDEQVLRRPLVSLAHGVLGRLPRRTIALSSHVAEFVSRHGRIPREGIEVIHYGIDREPFERARSRPAEEREALRAELGFREGDVLFVCVARFAPQKAHDVLLRAFAQARAKADGRLGLVLVGDDPFGNGRVRAERVAAELELEGDVVFTGIRRDVPELMAASEVFAMSSLWEGLGLVFLEAMATELPVLSTRVSAIPEVVVDGETGRLVPPGDPGPLAEAMVELAADPALRARLGRGGAERVREHFGLDRMVEHTLEVYERLLRS